MKNLFKRNEKGFYPDYTNDGLTIKKNWETLDKSADTRVYDILKEFMGDKNLGKCFENFHKISLEFPEADICKETTNPFIDFVIDFTGKGEEEIMKLFWEKQEKIFGN